MLDPVPSLLDKDEAHQGQGEVMDCATWVLESDSGGREGFWSSAAALVWHGTYPGGLCCYLSDFTYRLQPGFTVHYIEGHMFIASAC